MIIYFAAGTPLPQKAARQDMLLNFLVGLVFAGKKKETVVLIHSLREVVQSVVLLSGECRQDYGERIR